MGQLLDRLQRIGSDSDKPPSPEEVRECIRNPGKYPEIEAYLSEHPGIRELFYDLPSKVEGAARQHIMDDAYFNWEKRGRRHGHDQEDWDAAQARLCQKLQNVVSPQQ